MTRSTLSPLALTALKLLSERPMHPYEMLTTLAERGEDRLVKVRPTTLYHAVAHLENAGFIQSLGVSRENNRPERTSYEITAEGQVALKERVTELLAHPAEEYPIFPFVLEKSTTLPISEVSVLLRQRLENLEVQVQQLQPRLAPTPELRRYRLHIEYQLGQLETEISWLRKVITELDSGDLLWEQETMTSSPTPKENHDSDR